MPDRITKALNRESPDFVAALKSMVAPSSRPVGSKPLTGGEQLNKLKAAALKSQGGGQEQAPLRDAFLKELTDRRPRLSEISDALFSGFQRPVGDPGPSLGEMLEKSRAGRLNELATGYGIETKERSFDIQERRVSAAETANKLKQLEQADKRSHKVLTDFAKNNNLNIRDMGRLFQAVEDDPRQVNAVGLYGILHEKAQELDIQTRTTPKDYKDDWQNVQYPGGKTDIVNTTDPKAMADVRRKGGRLVGKSGGLNIEFDEGGKVSGISMGGGPVDPKTLARESTKREYKESLPVPNAIARLTGEDPGISVRDARAKGISVDIKETALQKLTETESAAITAIQLSRQLQNRVRKEPNILGAPGALAQFATSLKSQAEGLAKMFGVEITAARNVAAYDDSWRSLGIENAQIKSLILDLAFATAQARETGKLTNQDIERAIDTLGANIRDGHAFAEILNSYVGRIDLIWQNQVRSSLGAVRGSLVQELDDKIIGKATETGDLSDNELMMLSPAGKRRLYDMLKARQGAPQ